MFNRIQDLKLSTKESCFLWGARQSGKSTLLKKLFPDSPYYDLLLSNQYKRLITQPEILREELLAKKNIKKPIVIDEVQKIPALLDEVHWLIENKGLRFVLCGSSPRKLYRSGGNLLGGRAIRYQLFPLSYPEIDNFNLHRAINNGLLPKHYLSDNAMDLLDAYIGDYLTEEIAAESYTRNISGFSRFMEIAAFSNGNIVNYINIARECGVSAPTVKEYFHILIDTLTGYFIYPFKKRPKRRVILTPKFYFFDVGIVNKLLNRKTILPHSELFGYAFEHFILQQLISHSHYSNLHYPITYWRTASQFEVDFILGDHKVAIEIKGTSQAATHHLNGIKAISEEYNFSHLILVTLDPVPRKIGNITVLPYNIFLQKLWSGELIK